MWGGGAVEPEPLNTKILGVSASAVLFSSNLVIHTD